MTIFAFHYRNIATNILSFLATIILPIPSARGFLSKMPFSYGHEVAICL
jgi:hypothetical protein